jgi:hypothetical protein
VYLVDDTPTSIAEAYTSSDADDWKEVVHNKIDSILSDGIWKLTERPYGCKPVGCKWVFMKRLGLMVLLRSIRLGLWQRLHIKGRRRLLIYLLIRCYIRALLSLAASYGFIVVKTAFLNGELDLEIYMDHLVGFGDLHGSARWVCSSRSRKQGVQVVKILVRS